MIHSACSYTSLAPVGVSLVLPSLELIKCYLPCGFQIAENKRSNKIHSKVSNNTSFHDSYSRKS